jgi:tRNA(Arg) A34 adenosine deaminase TadA
MTLWQTLEEPWRIALEQAWAAYRAGSLPIGAVVVDADNQVVGRGRNRIFSTSTARSTTWIPNAQTSPTSSPPSPAHSALW